MISRNRLFPRFIAFSGALFASITFLVHSPSRSVAQEVEELRVGLLPALTGPFADLGADCVRGVEVAKQSSTQGGKVGNREIRIFVGDSQADAKVGLSEFRRLVDQEKVLAVLTMRSSVGMPLNPVSAQKHIPLLGAVGHSRFVPDNPYAFQFWPATDVEGRTLADYLIQSKISSVALVTAEDEWNVSLSSRFKEAFVSAGGRVVGDETVHAVENDISPIIGRLKMRKPEAVFINLGLFPGASAVRRLREQWKEVPLFSNYWSGTPAAIKAATPEAAEGLMFVETSLRLPHFLKMLEELSKIRGETHQRPSAMTYACYSAYLAVSTVAAGNQPLQNGEDFHRALLNLQKLELLDGPLSLSGRQAQYHLVMKRIEKGEVIEVGN